MNILMVCPYFHSSTCKRKLRPDVYEVSRRLAKRGHKVIVLTSKSYGAPSRENVDGVIVYRVISLQIPGIYYFIPVIPCYVRSLLILCKEYGINIVHFWNYEYLTSLLALVLRRKIPGMPIVISIIGFPGLNWRYGVGIVDLFGCAYTYTLGKIVLRSADRVIVLGRKLTRYAESLGVQKDRIYVNSFGIDLSEFYPGRSQQSVRAQLSIPISAKVVIFVGRIEPVKGTEYLLKAATHLVPLRDDLRFLIVGDGPLRSRFQKKYLHNRIIFLGWRNDIADLLNASDILVLPSISEGLPIVSLEALSLSKPVIATDVGALSDVILDRETGMLVSPGKWMELSDAIASLLGNPRSVHEMGVKGSEFIKRFFAWDEILRRYEDVYAG
jgi:glycosyltransferase involved in cell wall biosynthesis